MKYLALDFEYNQSNEPHMGLVSCDICTENNRHESIWLYNDNLGKQRLRKILERVKDGYVLVAHNVIAEASCLIALGLNPRQFHWCDTMLEYRQLQNGNANWQYGWAWKKEGPFEKFIKTVPLIPPNRLHEMDETFGEERERIIAFAKKDGQSHEMVKPNLVNALKNILDVEISATVKHDTIDLILERKPEYSEDERKQILEYGASDTEYLIPLARKLRELVGVRTARAGLAPENLDTAILWRGRAAANIATYTMAGMPVGRERWENLVANKQRAIREAIEVFSTQYDHLCEWDVGEQKYKFKKFRTDAWAEDLVRRYGIKWPKTKKGNYSMSTADGQPLSDYRDIIPEILDYCRLQELIKGLGAHADEEETIERKNANKDVFADYLGSDDRVRPYYGPFGTQTGRNAPKAVGFIPAQSGWLRGLINPKPGRVLLECDYSSQEALIAAVLSGDSKLLYAYTSGDPYLAFAVEAGAAPKTATKKTHGEIRNLFKSTVLGLQYGMGAAKLSIKLTADTGKKVSIEKAKELIALHKQVYPTYYQWKEQQWEKYRGSAIPLMLPDWWYLDIHNSSRLSTLNFPVQGAGSSMMRHMIDILLDAGIQVVCPVHDSCIVECEETDIERVTKIVTDAMLEASKRVLRVDGMRVGKPEILRHGEFWETEKNASSLKKFKKYFESASQFEEVEDFLKLFLSE